LGSTKEPESIVAVAINKPSAVQSMEIAEKVNQKTSRAILRARSVSPNTTSFK